MQLSMQSVPLRIFPVLGCVLLAAASKAQNVTVYVPPPPSFPRVFPNPTGLNGYEDFVMAADILTASVKWHDFEYANDSYGDQTLTGRRRILDDPQVIRALAAFRRGISKPLQTPRTTIDPETIFPEFSGLRMLARLLSVEMYVLFADGKVAQAIGSLKDALNIGYGIQHDTLIGGLVGIAIDAITLSQFARHVDQLSARDCEQLVNMAKEWLKLPDPQISIYISERDSAIRTLQKYRSDVPALLQLTQAGNSKDPLAGAYAELAQALQTHPETGGQVVDQAAAIITDRYSKVIAALQQPAWKRDLTGAGAGAADTPASVLANAIMPTFALALDKFTSEQARVQILGVHAAVRRYKWEYQRLPASLSDLHLGDLGLDPYTGKPIAYKLVGTGGYELSSSGPLAYGDDNKPIPGQHTTITLPIP